MMRPISVGVLVEYSSKKPEDFIDVRVTADEFNLLLAPESTRLLCAAIDFVQLKSEEK